MAYAADRPLLSKRALVALFFILLLHLGIFYAITEGLSHSLIQKILGPMQTDVIEEQKKEENEPPPPPPKVEAPPPFVPPPEISIEIPSEAPPPTAITTTTNVRPTAPPPVAAPAAPGTKPHADPKRPLTRPDYPASARRAGKAGTVVLELYVLENGRIGDARVKTSSGTPELDEAAMREARRSWRLVPGTEEGKPVAMWYPMAITFNLTD
jgi:periplasmic protein TonB